MGTHTPGPWTVFAEEPYGRNVGIEADAIPFSVIVWGENHEDDQGVQGRTRDEMLANARLIAAAPELLAALEACSFRLGVLVAASGAFEDVNAKALDQAVAAIQSATGAER